MPKYLFTVESTVYHKYFIEAEGADEDEASDAMFEKLHSGDILPNESETADDTILEVKEVK